MVKLNTVLQALLATLTASVASAASANKTPNKFAKGTVLVELEDDESVDNFYSEMSHKASPRMNLTYSLFKGASIQLHDSDESSTDLQIAEISAMSKVKKVWPVRLYPVPDHEVVWTARDVDAPITMRKRQDEEADDYSTHVMTQVDLLRAEGITGEGIKIAIIDTGIDYMHPALGGCFGEGCLVTYGTDLVGDDYTGLNTPIPDDDPVDNCQGHGSHVAGIVAAGTNPYDFTGAAPDVTLGAYRVFGCVGEVGDDVLIAAYMQAFEEGSDIISASIGGSSGWSEDAWAVAVQRIVEQGVPCVISAGNDGAVGMWYASTAAVGKGITAIASFENTLAPTLQVESTFAVDGGESQTFGWTPGTPDDWANITMPLWPVDYDITDPANGCDPYPEDTPDLSDRIVLVRRGTCTFVQKIQNAREYGAQYVIVYNNVPGTANIQGVVDGLVGLAMVTADQGEEWIGMLESGSEVVVSMVDPEVAGQVLEVFDNTGIGGFASDFTSWGPSFEMDVKPQIAAPGGKILSTYPLALGGYAVLSGTSMACPLSAAVVALLGQARGTLDPTTIENVLSSTANAQLFNDGAQAYSYLAPVVQQGAGLIQAYAAAHVTSILSPSSLSFNDTNNFVEALNFTISNTGSEDVTFEIRHVGAATAYTFAAPGDLYPSEFPNELVELYATPDFSSTKVTVPAGGESMVTVSMTPPEADSSRYPVYSGYITLNSTTGGGGGYGNSTNSTSGGENLALPYIGVIGSIRDLTVLDGAYAAEGTTGTPLPVSEGESFTLPAQGTNATDADVLPMAVIGLAFGSAVVTCELMSNNKSLGNIDEFPSEWNPRDPIFTNFTGLMADGTYAEEGAYSFLIKALRVYGDRDRASDYDSDQTAEFSIVYAEAGEEPAESEAVSDSVTATATETASDDYSGTISTPITSDVPSVEPTMPAIPTSEEEITFPPSEPVSTATATATPRVG
ncbi:subtilase [Zalerion maritima]|uniref:Subtilase n=1 Tax=Zalerion maritima TaxID=339359 RepID=A0AAD5RGM3_9PEZI|nr:subtilase [Zalerion maritima]